jgi:hypothetical protein
VLLFCFIILSISTFQSSAAAAAITVTTHLASHTQRHSWEDPWRSPGFGMARQVHPDSAMPAVASPRRPSLGGIASPRRSLSFTRRASKSPTKHLPLPSRIVEINTRAGDVGVTLKNRKQGAGVLISDMDPKDQAAQSGIQVGDILLAVNGKQASCEREIRGDWSPTHMLFLCTGFGPRRSGA